MCDHCLLCSVILYALQLVVENDAPKDMKAIERNLLSTSEVRTAGSDSSSVEQPMVVCAIPQKTVEMMQVRTVWCSAVLR